LLGVNVPLPIVTQTLKDSIKRKFIGYGPGDWQIVTGGAANGGNTCEPLLAEGSCEGGYIRRQLRQIQVMILCTLF
jgi:hypothetical protein